MRTPAQMKKIQVLRLGFFVKSGQKRYFGEFSYGLELVRPNHAERRVYHQNEVLYITKAKALYIIIAKEDTACG